MKTAQEQAEAMARKVGLARYGTNPTYSFDAVMKIIPLAELLAVAQAANKVATEKSIMNQMQAEFEMLKALDTLRATGKVEL